MKVTMARYLVLSSVVWSLLGSLCFRATGGAQETVNPEALGRGVLEALKQGSFEALAPYLSTADDFAEFTRAYPRLSEEKREEILSTKDAFSEGLAAHFTEQMERRRRRATGRMLGSSGLSSSCTALTATAPSTPQRWPPRAVLRPTPKSSYHWTTARGRST